MHIYEAMAQPIRRRIVDILASGEHFTEDIEAIIIHEFGVGRSAVQRHLKLLYEHDWVHVHTEDWPQHAYRLDDHFVDLLEEQPRLLREKWEKRIVGRVRADPFAHSYLPSKRGRRGRGVDPDDEWFRFTN